MERSLCGNSFRLLLPGRIFRQPVPIGSPIREGLRPFFIAFHLHILSRLIRARGLHGRTAHKGDRHPPRSWRLGFRNSLSAFQRVRQMGIRLQSYRLAYRLLCHEKLAAQFCLPGKPGNCDVFPRHVHDPDNRLSHDHHPGHTDSQGQSCKDIAV